MKQESRIERRTFEIRVASGYDGPVLAGYAAVFNSPSEWLGFREIIAPGAFKRSLETSPDIKALVEHDSSKIIARRSNGSLVVSEDDKGLAVQITPNDTSYAKDLVENVNTGLLDSMSFGFRVVEESWERNGSENVRTLHDVELIEVSIVSDPAYKASEIALRDLNTALAEYDERACEHVEDVVEAKPEEHVPEPEQEPVSDGNSRINVLLKKLDLLEREM